MKLKIFLIFGLFHVLQSEAKRVYIDDHHGGYVELKEEKKEEEQDLSKIPGVPGHDYPIYHEVPHTSFSCDKVPAIPGMYADVESGCQSYHVCQEHQAKSSFLCTNGTIFSQKEFTCDYWYNVPCHEAQNYWSLNADPEHNPYFPKKKPEEEQQKYYAYHP